MKRFLSFLLLLCVVSALRAQVSHGGVPRLNHVKIGTPVLKLPAVDNSSCLQEDIDMAAGASPMRVGVMQPVSIDLLHEAAVHTDADGTRTWRISLFSSNATFMALYFSEFNIPEGAQLFVYDDSGDFVLGAFTSQNRHPDGRFYTQPVPGELCRLEYRQPATATTEPSLKLSYVVHGYKDLMGMRPDPKGVFGTAGNCHYNVVCPEGDDWRDPIRSVCEILIATSQGYGVCTGALVNNTANDKTPYVLTAHHCQEGGDIIGYTFFFNYQTATCNGTDGPNNQSVTGAEAVAKQSRGDGSDFLLLRLYEQVPDSYEPYYAGWSRQAVEPSKGAGIHHPAGDYKKISLPWSVKYCAGNHYVSGVPIVARNYLQVDWSKGITEQGSSGSPLFNGDHLIVGQLCGGNGDCDNPGYALYGRFVTDWMGNGTADSRLSDWLDPLNTNAYLLHGLNYDAAVDTTIATPGKLHIYPNPSNGMVRFDVDEIGEATYRLFNLHGLLVYEGTTILATTTQAVNLTHLPAGAYTMELFIADKTYAGTVVICK